MLPGTACADHHMGIDDVGCLARCQQPADVRRIHPVEVRNVSRRLTNQAGQPDLPLRPPDSVGQRGRRNRDAGTGFPRAGKQDHYAAVIPVQRDQAARIEGHTGHQATDLPAIPSTSSAQARSLSDSAPPVSRNASAS